MGMCAQVRHTQRPYATPLHTNKYTTARRERPQPSDPVQISAPPKNIGQSPGPEVERLRPLKCLPPEHSMQYASPCPPPPCIATALHGCLNPEAEQLLAVPRLPRCLGPPGSLEPWSRTAPLLSSTSPPSSTQPLVSSTLVSSALAMHTAPRSMQSPRPHWVVTGSLSHAAYPQFSPPFCHPPYLAPHLLCPSSDPPPPLRSSLTARPSQALSMRWP